MSGTTPSDKQMACIVFSLVLAHCEPMAGRKACVSGLAVAVTYQPS